MYIGKERNQINLIIFSWIFTYVQQCFQCVCVTECFSKNLVTFATQSNDTEQMETTLQVLWAFFTTVHHHSENFIVDLISTK